jgi:hypothetical protein
VLTKIYFGLWGVMAVAAAVLFAIGNMTMLTLVVFGLMSFGLVFMGMMGVLPIIVTHPANEKTEMPAKAPRVSVA